MYVPWFVGVAAAQSFSVVQFPVLDETASPLVANGLGAPTVAWDPVDELYVMFFETNVAAATAACPVGTWAIGVASSPDGLSWDVWPTYAVAPTAGTPYACVAAHPTVIYEAGTFHLWFKAEQGNVGAGCGHAWGCTNYTGVGYASVDVSLDDPSDEIADLEAEIDALEAARDLEILAYDALLDAYVATMTANQTVFACVTGLSVCAPCTSVVLSAPPTTNKTFCQPFRFQIPSTIPRLSGSALVYTPTLTYSNGGAPSTCSYLGTTVFGGGQIFTGCSSGVGVGTNVTVTSLTVGSSSTGNVVVRRTFNANNAGSQTFDGPLFDQLEALLLETSVADAAGTAALLPGFITTLSTLESWLDDVGGNPRALVTSETQELIDEGNALLALIQSTAADIAALEDEIEVLEGYATGVDVTPLAGVALPLPTVFGYPNAAKIDGEYVLLLQDYPDLVRAHGASPTSLALDPTPVILAGGAPWAMTEVFEPALACTGDPVMPYTTWVGGRTNVLNVFSQAGLSDAPSADGVSFALNVSAILEWTDTNQYRHFDGLTNESGETRLWYTEKVAGKNRIGLMSTTTDPWVDAETTNRVCP